MFQCSSASRKFLNFWSKIVSWFDELCFSALQRAENSSIGLGFRAWLVIRRFSALQRAENSSIQLSAGSTKSYRVSVLFSEPKIPQYKRARVVALKREQRFSALQRAENSSIFPAALDRCRERDVSVLFSEPKIPQFWCVLGGVWCEARFSALQRAENSSIRR